MKIGVVTFPGTLDDRDAARAVKYAGAQAVSLWHGDADLPDHFQVQLAVGGREHHGAKCAQARGLSRRGDTEEDGTDHDQQQGEWRQ